MQKPLLAVRPSCSHCGNPLSQYTLHKTGLCHPCAAGANTPCSQCGTKISHVGARMRGGLCTKCYTSTLGKRKECSQCGVRLYSSRSVTGLCLRHMREQALLSHPHCKACGEWLRHKGTYCKKCWSKELSLRNRISAKDLSLARVQSLRRNSMQNVSKAELWAAELLEHLGVPFKRQVPFGSYLVDFVVSAPHRLVVEVYGGYWHTTPEAIARDSKRQSFIEKTWGCRMVVLWGNKPHLWESTLLEALGWSVLKKAL
jgi:very-short-patch-repair endonuclease